MPLDRVKLVVKWDELISNLRSGQKKLERERGKKFDNC
jgi:hypothetical protein